MGEMAERGEEMGERMRLAAEVAMAAFTSTEMAGRGEAEGVVWDWEDGSVVLMAALLMVMQRWMPCSHRRATAEVGTDDRGGFN